MPKKTNKLRLDKGLVIDKIDWNDPKISLPTSLRCMTCYSNQQTLINENALTYATLPVEKRIALLTEIIQQKMLVMCIFSQNDLEFYQLKLKFELENQQQQQLKARELLLTRSGTELLSLLGLRKIHANGTRREIGMKWGEFIFHAKNAKGELMFDIEAVEVAKLIEVIVEPPVGKEFVHHTMEGYVGEGRNL